MSKHNAKKGKNLNHDQLLVSGWLEDDFAAQSEYKDKDSFFEYVSADKLLAEYDLDEDELREGLVGGGQDGGVDSLYVFVNRIPLREGADLPQLSKASVLSVIVIQSKNKTTFEESVPQKWCSLFEDLLDFNKDETALLTAYSNSLVNRTMLFRKAYKGIARRGGSTVFEFHYATLGSIVPDGVVREMNKLERVIQTRLSDDIVVKPFFDGAEKFFSLWSRWSNQDRQLRFSETPISVHGRHDFIGLVKLGDYYEFMTDDGALSQFLFDANVRDFQGAVAVNKGIRNTLNKRGQEDFWWLNNGVTIVATEASQVVGGEIRLSEPRIVNGLQTSVEIANYIATLPDKESDNRQLLVRVIVPESEETRDKVILATNSQTQVQKTALRATDPVHRRIEEYFKRQGLFYDRRKNYYKNQGKKASEIVSISYLSQCMMTLILHEPNQARARPSTLLADDSKYHKLFSSKTPLEVYYKAALAGKTVEKYFNLTALADEWRPLNSNVPHEKLVELAPRLEGRMGEDAFNEAVAELGLNERVKARMHLLRLGRGEITDLRFYVLYIVVSRIARAAYVSHTDVKTLAIEQITRDSVAEAAILAAKLYFELGGASKVAKGQELTRRIIEALNDELHASQNDA